MTIIYSDQGVLTGQRAVVGYRGQMCEVRLIGRAVANKLIRENHYSRRTYNNSLHHFGVFVDGRLCGALQWGQAMNPASGGGIVKGATIDQWRELNRMWISDDAPRNTESSAIAASVKVLRHIAPQVAFLQSFADERCGGLGVVYQAASFGFFGSHIATFWRLDGEWFHNIAATTGRAAGGARAAELRRRIDEAERFDLRQFRYLRFLKPWARRACLLTEEPYPKPEPVEPA
jgi:adenine modification enzyme